MSWIPEYTQLITPDGKIYNFESSERYIITEEGYGMPDIDYIVDKAPNQHGDTVRDYRFKPRVVQIQLRQDTCDRYDYWAERYKLVDYLRPNRQLPGMMTPFTLRKLLPNGDMRDLAVWIQQGPVFSARSVDHWDEYGYTETLRFTADDPIFTNPIKHSIAFTLAPFNQLSFPVSFPIMFGGNLLSMSKDITYLGNFEAFPFIILRGPMTHPEIVNSATAETIQLDYDLKANEVVTIDLTPGEKTITNQFGTDLYGTLHDPTDISTFHLAPEPEAPLGVNPILVIAGGVDLISTRITVEYYERIVGG